MFRRPPGSGPALARPPAMVDVEVTVCHELVQVVPRHVGVDTEE